jgi:anhydro-N-acetylmuramic acid kinase
MRVLGVMTGTSCDGLDAACVEFRPESGKTADASWPHWQILWSSSVSYPKPLRERILSLQLPGKKISIRDFLALDRDLGKWYGKTIREFILQHGQPDVIANHGQTVAHHPDLTATLQLGDPTRIMQETGLSVISHFREGDMAAGGQGAPLLPLFHTILSSRLPEAGQGLAIQNLGGISNLTYIHPTDPAQTLAFDTGPSNIWIDDATSLATKGKKKFDAGGAIGRRGTVDETAIKKLLSHPYFKKKPPKSTGRDDFPFSFFKSKTRARGADLVATATELTVESIAQAYEKNILQKNLPLTAIYCAGGGAKNQYLMECLARRLAPVQVKRLSDAGIAGLSEQFLEPLGFAMFGYLSLMGRPVGGVWTGVREFGAPGWITPGKNWASVVSQTAAEIPRYEIRSE